MPENKARFVLVCQQFLALGTVAALAAPALGVVNLEIVRPPPDVAGSTHGPAVGETGRGDVPAARGAASLVAAGPVEPEVTEVPIDGALSSPTPVEGFATVGVTWDGDERLAEDEVTVSVRSLEDGTWGAWEEIEYHDEHGPDPESVEGRGARQGTEPIVVGEVDQVQVKIATRDGRAPGGAELAVVDPRDVAAQVQQPAIDTARLPASGTTLSSSPTGSGASDAAMLTAGATAKPTIFSRAQWGADERLRGSAPSYHEVHAGFVHHTVNANDYTRAQVPSLIRGIYAYHTKSRGWSDIGYNFIVDKFGRVWEGRHGGVDRPVVGAHTIGYNEHSFAMSALGNFDTARPPAAMLEAYGRLFAWKLSLHGVDASSTRQRVGTRNFPAVNGHRDAGRTACPGRYLYARLDAIRALAAKYQRPFTRRTRSTDLAGSRWPDLIVRDRSTKQALLVRTGGQTNFAAGTKAASDMAGMDLLTAPGDLTGDGIPDLLARDGRTKLTGIYPGTRRGTFGRKTHDISRFRGADQLTGSRDLDGDGRNDVVARIAATKQLVLFPGDGKGALRRRTLLAKDWSGYDLTAGVGDLNGDGRNDLVARTGGELHLVLGKGKGLGARRVLPGRWGRYSHIAGMGDLTNDGRPDLVAKVARTKVVHIFPGDGRGGLGRALGPFPQFKHLNFLATAGQLSGNAGKDLVGRARNGDLRVYANNGARNLEAVTEAGWSLRAADLVLNVGDWNGDGHADVMTRSRKTGKLYLRTGDGRGGFGPARLAGTGWGGLELVTAVGDVTGDGSPDLMGQPVGRAMRIYPGDGSRGFRESYVAHSSLRGLQHQGLGLWDGDGAPDSLLRRSDGALWLYRGNGPGGLVEPTKIGVLARGYRWMHAAGDVTGNGRPDLLAADKAGRLWVHPGHASGFGTRRLVGDGFGVYDLVG